MRNKVASILIAGIVLIVAGIATGAVAERYGQICLLANMSQDNCPGHVEFDAGGAVLPKKLPPNKMAPAGIELHGEIAMKSGDHPPALREVIIDIAENVSVDAPGLPSCRLPQLESRGVAAARRLCRKAIVGTGVSHIGFASSDTTIEAPLTLFNGGTSDGKTKLFVHSAIGVPNLIPLVGIVKIQRKHSGLHTIWKSPPILEGDGSLLDFRFRIERRFMSQGVEHSYLAAKCPDGALQASVPKVLFRNEAHAPGQAATTALRGSFSVPCSPPGR